MLSINADISVHYSLGASDLSMAAVARTAGWVSLAFPATAGDMAPADAVIGTDTVGAYRISGMDATQVKIDASQALLAGDVFRNVSSPSLTLTTLRFWRKLDNGGTQVLKASGTLQINWAFGTAVALNFHNNNRGSFAIDYASGVATIAVSSADEVLQNVRRAHGALMIVAWAVLIPAGVAAALAGRHLDPLWFNLHRYLNSAGLFIAVISWVAGVATFSGDYTHGLIGLIIMFAALFQPLNALCRPLHTSPRRWIWNLIHHWMGRSVLVLAFINLLIGANLIRNLQGDPAWKFVVPVCLLLLTFGIGTAGAFFLHKRAMAGSHEFARPGEVGLAHHARSSAYFVEAPTAPGGEFDSNNGSKPNAGPGDAAQPPAPEDLQEAIKGASAEVAAAAAARAAEAEGAGLWSPAYGASDAPEPPLGGRGGSGGFGNAGGGGVGGAATRGPGPHGV